MVDLPPPDPSVVHVEYRTGGIYMEREEEVKIYSDIFMRLEDAAIDIEQSSALIRTLANKSADLTSIGGSALI